MTEEQIVMRRQLCFQMAAQNMQFTGRPGSTAPTMDEVKAAAESLYEWMTGTEV